MKSKKLIIVTVLLICLVGVVSAYPDYTFLDTAKQYAYKILFDITGCDDDTAGIVCWDTDANTIKIVTDLGNTIQVGQETYGVGKNVDSVTIYDGSLVCMAGFQGEHPVFVRANASNIALSANCGVLTAPCEVNEFCPVTTFGFVNGLDTSNMTQGDLLYSDPDVLGGLTTDEPLPYNDQNVYAVVGRINPSVGNIFVQKFHNPNNGFLTNNIYVSNNINIESLQDTYIDGSAYLCIYDNGTLYSSESGC